MDKKSCVFHANWLQAAQSIKDLRVRCLFYEAVLQYALTGMKTDVPPELELVITFVYSLIDVDRSKYEKTCERRREAANARWEKLHQANDAAQCKDMQTMQMHNLHYDTGTDTETETDTETDTDTDKKSNDFIIPPLTPQGANGGAGASSFKDFLGRVKAIQVPKAVQDSGYTTQYVWRMAEGQPGYGLAVNAAIRESANQEEFVQRMQAANATYKARTEFMAVKLALATARCTPAQQAAVIAETERAGGEKDLWKTLLEKVNYILGGGKVGSLAGFMRARQGNSNNK